MTALLPIVFPRGDADDGLAHVYKKQFREPWQAGLLDVWSLMSLSLAAKDMRGYATPRLLQRWYGGRYILARGLHWYVNGQGTSRQIYEALQRLQPDELRYFFHASEERPGRLAEAVREPLGPFEDVPPPGSGQMLRGLKATYLALLADTPLSEPPHTHDYGLLVRMSLLHLEPPTSDVRVTCVLYFTPEKAVAFQTYREFRNAHPGRLHVPIYLALLYTRRYLWLPHADDLPLLDAKELLAGLDVTWAADEVLRQPGVVPWLVRVGHQGGHPGRLLALLDLWAAADEGRLRALWPALRERVPRDPESLMQATLFLHNQASPALPVYDLLKAEPGWTAPSFARAVRSIPASGGTLKAAMLLDHGLLTLTASDAMEAMSFLTRAWPSSQTGDLSIFLHHLPRDASWWKEDFPMTEWFGVLGYTFLYTLPRPGVLEAFIPPGDTRQEELLVRSVDRLVGYVHASPMERRHNGTPLLLALLGFCVGRCATSRVTPTTVRYLRFMYRYETLETELAPALARAFPYDNDLVPALLMRRRPA